MQSGKDGKCAIYSCPLAFPCDAGLCLCSYVSQTLLPADFLFGTTCRRPWQETGRQEWGKALALPSSHMLFQSVQSSSGSGSQCPASSATVPAQMPPWSSWAPVTPSSSLGSPACGGSHFLWLFSLGLPNPFPLAFSLRFPLLKSWHDSFPDLLLLTWEETEQLPQGACRRLPEWNRGKAQALGQGGPKIKSHPHAFTP